MARLKNFIWFVEDRSQKPDKTHQILYIEQTNLVYQNKMVIKVGKTIQQIPKYETSLFKSYAKLIKFRTLAFFIIEYDPNTPVDHYFHKKLLKAIPQNKLYLQIDNQSFHLEFYTLEAEFVNCFCGIMEKFQALYIEKSLFAQTDAKNPDSSNGSSDYHFSDEDTAE